MLIINNNNNGPNGVFPRENFRRNSPQGDNALTLALESVKNGEKISRKTYIALSCVLGCFGVHYFAVKQWARGFICCILTAVGFLSFVALIMTLLLGAGGYEPVLAMCIVFMLFLPLSVMGGLISSCYWFFHTDQDFEKAFYGQEDESEIQTNER